MWTAPCFVGDDNKKLINIQHDLYWDFVGMIFEDTKFPLLNAKDKRTWNVDYLLLSRLQVTESFDHRVLQHAHDKIAAFFRFYLRDVKPHPLESDDKLYEEYLKEIWKVYFLNEVGALTENIEFSKNVAVAVMYANSPKGRLAEKRIGEILDDRYGDQYWELRTIPTNT